jgi:hypothetical protein
MCVARVQSVLEEMPERAWPRRERDVAAALGVTAHNGVVAHPWRIIVWAWPSGSAVRWGHGSASR